MKPSEFLSYLKEKSAEFLDLKFVDPLGTWQHCTYPVSGLNEALLEEGFGFDASSIRMWQSVMHSDMIAIPDLSTARVDPFFEAVTVSVLGNVYDPVTREPYHRDPRNIAGKGMDYLNKSKIGDSLQIGPEPEFFIFDEVRFTQTQNMGFYQIDSVEGAWNTNRMEEPNLGHKASYQGGYFPVAPTDTFSDLRGEMCRVLDRLGIEVEAHHHEVATGGQSEIDMKFADFFTMADQLKWYKYVVKNVARKHGKTATFMPKPIVDDYGSGMHIHFSLWRDGQNLFAGNGEHYAGLSEIAIYAIGGILKHTPSLLAFAAPTTNSYRRLVPGYEAPVNLVYSASNRSAAVRIPMYSQDPRSKRIEFRCPDSAANGYLTFTALLMAVLDGIERKLDPGKPLEKNIYQLGSKEKNRIKSVPVSLRQSLKALERDHDYLLKEDVFTEDFIDAYIKYKMTYEVDKLASKTHPFEFSLYYDN